MCVFNEEMEVRVNMHVNVDGSIVDEVVMKIGKILSWITQLFYPFNQLFFLSEMKFLTFQLHVSNSLVL